MTPREPLASDRTDVHEMKDLVATVGEVLSVYAAVDGEGEVETIAAVATSVAHLPSWFRADLFESAVASAISVEAAGVAFFQRPDDSMWTFPLVDPPRTDVATVASLPDLVPLLEVLHRTIDHLVVTTVAPELQSVAEPVDLSIVHVPGTDQSDAIVATASSANPSEIASFIGRYVKPSCEIVVSALPVDIATAVNDRLAESLPPSTQIVAVDRRSPDLASSIVRAVADYSARDLVQTLRMFRFLDAHSQVAEGLGGVVAALTDGSVTKLLLGDTSAHEDSRLFVQPDGAYLSLEPVSDWPSVRPIDGLVRSALLQGVPIQIIPREMAHGPAGGIGALLKAPS